MWRKDTVDNTTLRYLLGQLPDAERDTFEDRYFSDDQLHEQVLAIEEELIDAYVNGELEGQDKTAFERRFLSSPEYRHKLAFAQALARQADRETPESTRAAASGDTSRSRRDWTAFFAPLRFGGLAWVGAAIVILLAIGYIWNSKTRGPSVQSTLAVVLAPATRDAGSTQVKIDSKTGQVRLDLMLNAASYPQYLAEVQTADGIPVITQNNLTAQPRGQTYMVTAVVPSRLLPPGDYKVKLTGAKPDGSHDLLEGYVFQVRN